MLDLLLDNFNLSKQQKKIVDSTEDNILVIACPGSGKTHTLIAKYINMLLKHDLKPEETIMITFTKKAGIEMLNRLKKIIPNKIPYHVGTIHGLSYKILKEYNNLKNIIIDEQDVKNYLNNIIDTQNLENCEIIKLKIQNIIDQSSITFPFDMKSILKKYNLEKYSKDFNLIYKLYKQKKKKENLIDFNDLMIMLNNFLLDKSSDNFKNKIKYVFFDEYQDVNSIQHNILLKISVNSKVMVVGDDAQSIYSFRGSSVNYILNYNLERPYKMYLLEENYRSTQPIIDFCQDIISHNLNQFNKNIINKLTIDNTSEKPEVKSFKTVKDQYEWVVNDILKKVQSGVQLSDIAILSRKNNLLNNIEFYLINKNIQITKNLGLSLLNKPHIKDFIAFIIILINPKSSLHWERIINLHSKDLDKDSNKSYLNLAKENLPELYNIIIQIKNKKEDDKIKLIINYLEKFWSNENKNDIYNLVNYLKNSSLEEFINNIYLNEDIEINVNDTLYLSTIHGAKGLEWKYVYIIDMNSKDFSYIKPKNYLEELEEMDEERRLFYVASSRAKEKLYITYHNYISPLLREINTTLYTGSNVNIDKIKPTLNISTDVKNYLSIFGYSNINKLINQIINNKSIINKRLDIPNNLNISIINDFIIFLIFRIIQIKYPTKIKNIQNELNVISWDKIIDDIFSLPLFKHIDTTNYKLFLISNNYYSKIEKSISKIIDMINPKEIYINYITSYGNVSGNIDIICDNYIIDIGNKLECNYICEKLLHAYLLKKNNHIISNMIFYDPINGEINNLDIKEINIINFKKIIYNI
jgi:DNA helicase-2/ATP-dependent DNA helicase PcrA